MGLFSKKPLTVQNPIVQRLYDDLSDTQKKHIDQTTLNLLQGNVSPNESLLHIAVNFLTEEHPHPIAITNRRIFNFSRTRVWHEIPIGAVTSHRCGTRKHRRYPHLVSIDLGGDKTYFAASTELEALAFSANLARATGIQPGPAYQQT